MLLLPHPPIGMHTACTLHAHSPCMSATRSKHACMHAPCLQVMWRFLEQKSFPLSEQEYMQQLDAVAEYLTEWGVVEK